MPRILLCAAGSLERDLADTFFLRADVERQEAGSFDEVEAACQDGFDLVVVDSDLGDASRVIRHLRREAGTRHVSIVVLSRRDFDPGELELLECGANGILRFPPTPDWDERLTRLCSVPIRKEARFPLEFEPATLTGGAATQRAQTRNLSVTGLLLESSEELAVGTHIEFRFPLPAGDDVRGRGRIVRRAARGQLFGIEFEHLEGDAVARIQAFVDSRTTASQTL